LSHRLLDRLALLFTDDISHLFFGHKAERNSEIAHAPRVTRPTLLATKEP